MKILTMTTTFMLLIISNVNAQITFAPHPIEIKANVEEISNILAPTANSTCGEVNIELDEKVFSGGCAGVLVREYRASDSCGNFASSTQFIHLTDTSAPVFVNTTAEIQIAAEGEIPLLTPGVSDAGKQDVSLKYEDQVLSERINRVWTAEDACGNKSQFVQTIWHKAKL